jgi:hypothetical protein
MQRRWTDNLALMGLHLHPDTEHHAPSESAIARGLNEEWLLLPGLAKTFDESPHGSRYLFILVPVDQLRQVLEIFVTQGNHAPYFDQQQQLMDENCLRVHVCLLLLES